MNNFWLIAKHEYKRIVFRRAFLLITLAVPIGFAALIGLIAIVQETKKSEPQPIGYVDYTGMVELARYPASDEGMTPIVEFTDETAALDALQQEEIAALFILPDTYPAAPQTELYYLENPPDGSAWRDFNFFISLNLLASYPEDVRHRLIAGGNITVYDIVSGREFREDGTINVVFPFIATIIFFTSTMMASGYMLEIVADEKENRMLEMMLTAVSPGQLIGGKAVGLLAATLTQLTAHILILAVGLIIATPYIPTLQQLVIPWGYVGVMALFFFPAYALIAAIMIAAGGILPDVQQSQQIAGVLNLLFILPLFSVVLIFENAGSPLVVFLSLFPTTSFLTISLRWGVGTVPLWQIVTSWLILVTTTGLMLWTAVKIFRAGMLRYGQKLNLKGALAALRS
ncbi:MAG: ABC transporter permease [Ardenticatenaceae bacterium]|nr:ABC transporter permease [Ardenticatenaceae bacterium]